MLGITSIIIMLASLLYWTWYTRRRPGEPPIYPGAWPIIGHAHLVLGDSIHFWKFLKTTTYNCMKNGYANIFYIGPVKIYLVSDPDDITQITNTCLEKDMYTRKFSKDLCENGLLFSSVSIWKRHRKLINPTFNQQVLDGFIPVFNSQARQLVKQMAVEIHGEPFDHSHYIRPNFMETICLTVLNDEVKEEEAKLYAKSIETYLKCSASRFRRIWLHWDFSYQFSTLKKTQDASVKAIRDICDSVLLKKRAQRKQNKHETDKENSGYKLKTFIDLMMELDDGEFTDEEIRDEMNMIIIAGHETSANVVTFALSLIGSYPKVQEKLYEELQAVFGSTDRNIERQDFSELVYLDAVLKETMRYYTMASLLSRHIDQEVKLKHCTLLPGHTCTFLLHGVHRNPMWGPDVDEFNPERWLDPDTLPVNPNAFVAFSLGRRNCIVCYRRQVPKDKPNKINLTELDPGNGDATKWAPGQSIYYGKTYAMMLMKTVCSHILRRYKIRSDHTKVVLKLDVLLKPHTGHEITLQERSQ